MSYFSAFTLYFLQEARQDFLYAMINQKKKKTLFYTMIPLQILRDLQEFWS